MKHIAKQGNTFIDKNGVDVGNIILTTNISEFTEVEIKKINKPVIEKTSKSLKERRELIDKYKTFLEKQDNKD